MVLALYASFCDFIKSCGDALVPSLINDSILSLEKVASIPADQIRFLLVLLFCYLLGALYRQIPGVYARHVYSIVVGIWLCHFLVSYQWIHTLISSLATYFLLSQLGPERGRYVCFAFSLGYLALLHIYRMATDYLGWSMDVTMQQMIITQKLCAIGYNWYDGTSNPAPDDEQKKYGIKKLPNLLEFLAWVYFAPLLPMGPFMEFNDFIENAEGRTMKSVSPLIPSLKRLGPALIYLVIFQIGNAIVPISYLNSPELQSKNLFAIYTYVWFSTWLIRFKYYFGFKITEGAALLSGLGYAKTEVKKDDKVIVQEHWDRMESVDVKVFELAQSYYDSSRSWNKMTNLWLRRYVYVRTPSSVNLYLTYTVSAFWHGFYPGYYLYFLTIAIMQNVSRKIRNSVRPRAVEMGEDAKKIYDILGWFATATTVNYFITSFLLLEFSASVNLFKSMYFFIHIICAVVFVVMNSGLIRPPKVKKEE